MKKFVVLVTIIILLIVSYFSYISINNYYKDSNIKKDEILELKNTIIKLDNSIKDAREKNNNIKIDEDKEIILKVWQKELKKVKNL